MKQQNEEEMKEEEERERTRLNEIHDMFMGYLEGRLHELSNLNEQKKQLA